MEREERKQLLIKLKRLPLEQLIESPNCNFECPDNKKFACCVDEGCGRGHFKKDEKEERFTEEDIKLIDSLWDKQTGFLRPHHCALPRRLMSINCLRHICKTWRKP